MTPEPKNLAAKKQRLVKDLLVEEQESNSGTTQPNMEPMKITKMAEMRIPTLPSYSLPNEQSIVTMNSASSPPFCLDARALLMRAIFLLHSSRRTDNRVLRIETRGKKIDEANRLFLRFI